MKGLFITTYLALGIGAACAQSETQIYVNATIPLDKGKTTVEGGASYSQTRGNTTTSVSGSTNGRSVTVTGSQTTRQGR